MPKDLKIQCPLCRVPMEFKLKQSERNEKANQVVMICPKCGQDPKAALRVKLAKL